MENFPSFDAAAALAARRKALLRAAASDESSSSESEGKERGGESSSCTSDDEKGDDDDEDDRQEPEKASTSERRGRSAKDKKKEKRKLKTKRKKKKEKESKKKSEKKRRRSRSLRSRSRSPPARRKMLSLRLPPPAPYTSLHSFPEASSFSTVQDTVAALDDVIIANRTSGGEGESERIAASVCLLLASGHAEAAAARVAAAAEFYFLAPEGLRNQSNVSYDALLENFERFWESGAPLACEEEASGGWRGWLESGCLPLPPPRVSSSSKSVSISREDAGLAAEIAAEVDARVTGLLPEGCVCYVSFLKREEGKSRNSLSLSHNSFFSLSTLFFSLSPDFPPPFKQRCDPSGLPRVPMGPRRAPRRLARVEAPPRPSGRRRARGALSRRVRR